MTTTLYRSVPIFALSGGYVHNKLDINNGMMTEWGEEAMQTVLDGHPTRFLFLHRH
jgi:hypothetical protein